MSNRNKNISYDIFQSREKVTGSPKSNGGAKR
jgi:hypothetical protein